MKLLITGGSGFIGSHLVDHFQDKADITLLTRKWLAEDNSALQGKTYRCLKGELTDRGIIRNLVAGIDYVFHLAAKTHGDSVDMAETNIIGTIILLEEASRAGVKKLVFSSSAAVHGDGPPCKEHDYPYPMNTYGTTKVFGEMFCEQYTDSGPLPTVCLRYFNVYGPRDRDSSVVSTFIRCALKNEPIRIHGSGEQTRDFVYVDDVVRANDFFCMSQHTGVFNIATGVITTINQLANEIIALTNSMSQIIHMPERPDEIRHSVASMDKTKQTGFFTTVSLREGLARTIEAHGKAL